MNNLKKKIGIIGGGQLGKMMILDAKRLGFYVITLDPTKLCPSHSISDEHIIAAFDDALAIRQLAEKVDVITYEFEHIDVRILKKLSNEGYTIYPTPDSLEIIQDKSTQKLALLESGIQTPEFRKVNTQDDLYKAGEIFGYPMMLKACTGGYDGKGNAVIRHTDEVEEAYELLGAGKQSLMIERFIPFIKEISVLACRGELGEVVIYPVAENIHINSILDETIVPANISKGCTKKAMELAKSVMTIFHGVGMFCIEMFVTDKEELYINEVAPRPHNSGHYTIEGCLTSQFENHIRAITGLPLGEVALRSPVAMKNLLGEPGETGKACVLGLEEAYQSPNVKVHIYGKLEVAAYRKMGHIVAIGSSIEEVRKTVEKGYKAIRIIGS